MAVIWNCQIHRGLRDTSTEMHACNHRRIIQTYKTRSQWDAVDATEGNHKHSVESWDAEVKKNMAVLQ